METIIIGGGLSGLVCARKLQAAGHDCQILEATDRIGGRIKTDNVDGFLLDHGFQVFLTAYPEARDILDYDALQLKSFEPGAVIQTSDGLQRLVDPWRRPQHLLATAFSKAATFGDKLKIGSLRGDVTRGDMATAYEWEETPTIDMLRSRGFSDTIIESFFRPFLGGIFLDGELKTSSRMLAFVFRNFSQGDAALPEKGMEEIPKQLAEGLKEGSIRTNARVESLESGAITLVGGEQLNATNIVIATEEPAAKRLLGQSPPDKWQQVYCHYFRADNATNKAITEAPLDEAILVLNGTGTGPINNLCVPSQVSSTYAPEGKSLISITTLTDQSQTDITKQLTDWFGAAVNDWQHLKTYHIEYALPAQTPPALSPVEKAAKAKDGIYVCGDYLDTASINGAMAAGRRAAEAILDSAAAS